MPLREGLSWHRMPPGKGSTQWPLFGPTVPHGGRQHSGTPFRTVPGESGSPQSWVTYHRQPVRHSGLCQPRVAPHSSGSRTTANWYVFPQRSSTACSTPWHLPESPPDATIISRKWPSTCCYSVTDGSGRPPGQARQATPERPARFVRRFLNCGKWNPLRNADETIPCPSWPVRASPRTTAFLRSFSVCAIPTCTTSFRLHERT
jgi:hypothetical protein